MIQNQFKIHAKIVFDEMVKNKGLLSIDKNKYLIAKKEVSIKESIKELKISKTTAYGAKQSLHSKSS